jgi:hypothetical protein
VHPHARPAHPSAVHQSNSHSTAWAVHLRETLASSPSSCPRPQRMQMPLMKPGCGGQEAASDRPFWPARRTHGAAPAVCQAPSVTLKFSNSGPICNCWIDAHACLSPLAGRCNRRPAAAPEKQVDQTFKPLRSLNAGQSCTCTLVDLEAGSIVEQRHAIGYLELFPLPPMALMVLAPASSFSTVPSLSVSTFSGELDMSLSSSLSRISSKSPLEAEEGAGLAMTRLGQNNNVLKETDTSSDIGIGLRNSIRHSAPTCC